MMGTRAGFAVIVQERQRYEALRRAALEVIPDLEENLEVIAQCFQNGKGGYDTPEDAERVGATGRRLLALRQAIKR